MICKKYKYAFQRSLPGASGPGWSILEATYIRSSADYRIDKRWERNLCVMGIRIDGSDVDDEPHPDAQDHRWSFNGLWKVTFYETLDDLYLNNLGYII